MRELQRPGEEIQAFLVGAMAHCTLAGEGEIVTGLFLVAGLQPMMPEQRRKQVRPSEIGGAEVDQAPVADDETENLLRKVLVTEALQALSPAHREVLNETILRDRTVNQAAEVLGVPVGTVKSRVYYGLKALRIVMAERGVTA